MVCSSIPM